MDPGRRLDISLERGLDTLVNHVQQEPGPIWFERVERGWIAKLPSSPGGLGPFWCIDLMGIVYGGWYPATDRKPRS